MIRQLHTWLPESVSVTLLGDRAFGCAQSSCERHRRSPSSRARARCSASFCRHASSPRAASPPRASPFSCSIAVNCLTPLLHPIIASRATPDLSPRSPPRWHRARQPPIRERPHSRKVKVFSEERRASSSTIASGTTSTADDAPAGEQPRRETYVVYGLANRPRTRWIPGTSSLLARRVQPLREDHRLLDPFRVSFERRMKGSFSARTRSRPRASGTEECRRSRVPCARLIPVKLYAKRVV